MMIAYCDAAGYLGINEGLEKGSIPLGYVKDDKIDELLALCYLSDDDNMSYIVTEVAEAPDRPKAMDALRRFIQNLVRLEIIEPMSFNEMRRLLYGPQS